MNTCRFCKGYENEFSKYPLVKYGVRHYAHADCGLKAKGAAFFDSLTQWQLEQFPYFAAKDCGLDAVLVKKLEGYTKRIMKKVEGSTRAQ